MKLLVFSGGLMKLSKDFKKITKTYRNLTAQKNISGSDEWLLDNYYIIEEEAKPLLKKTLPDKCLNKAKKYLLENDWKTDGIEHIAEKYKMSTYELRSFPDCIKAQIILRIAEICDAHNDGARMGILIRSLYGLRNILWEEFFEKHSIVDSILGGDPYYSDMTFETKELYRNKVSLIARKYKLNEREVAEAALSLSKNRQGRQGHVGYYLIDLGKRQLLEKFGIKSKKRKNKTLLYLISTGFLTTVFGFIVYRTTGSIIASIAVNLPVMDISVNLVNWLLLKVTPTRRLPALKLKDGVPEKVLIVYPTLLSSAEKAVSMTKKLEICYLANSENNLCFGILGDFKDSTTPDEDLEVIEKTRAEIKKLNKKYGEKFFYLHREKIFSDVQNRYMGRERKRGAIEDLNRFLRKKYKFKYTEGNTALLSGIRMVITLDDDTLLPIGGANKLIGSMLHPLNRPVVHKGVVKEGYGVIAPRISTKLESANKTFFSKVFAGQGGFEPYSTAVSELYSDVFGEAVFTGKGIYDVDSFVKCMSVPENTVLSHDLLEGSYVRCAFASDVEVFDGFPYDYLGWTGRLHRWIRGDFQLVAWLFPTVRNGRGDKVKNPLNMLSKWKIYDNLRRSITPVFNVILIIVSAFWGLEVLLVALISLCFPLILYLVDNVIMKSFYHIGEKINSSVIYGAKGLLYQTALNISFLAYNSCLSLDGAIRGLVRGITHKKTLEWVTAADAEKNSKNSVMSYYRKMMWSPVLGAATVVCSLASNLSAAAIIFGIIWATAPLIAYSVSQPQGEDVYHLPKEKITELYETAKRIWSFFNDFMSDEDNFLPPDNVQIRPFKGAAHRTSPTNIGLGLISLLCAADLGFITPEDMADRMEKALSSIARLPKWKGHLYNWYNTKTLEPMRPHYVSSVDSGNFVCYLMTVIKGLEDYKELGERGKKLASEMEKLVRSTEFLPLYDEKRNLFSIGFNIHENRLTDSYYDLLASEARQAGFVAIALGQISSKHWFHLSRSLTSSDGYKGLLSWSGTMFEYLMPGLIMKNYKNSIWDETYWFVIRSQKKYGRKRKIPWGVSESGFYAFDSEKNYQYKAFGVPEMGLRRDLKEDVVNAPYATLLALMADPKSALANLALLKKEGAYGEYGYFEAIDYTPSRTNGKSIVRSYMAHHQGMALASITNLLKNNILQKRFHSWPEIRATEYLLEEKIPVKVSLMKEHKERIEPVKIEPKTQCVRKYQGAMETLPIHLLSNGTYTVMTDKNGYGVSFADSIRFNRFDFASRDTGQLIFIRDTENGKIQSAYGDRCVFSNHTAEFFHSSNNLETSLKISLAPDDNCELRRLTIVNKTGHRKELEIAYYSEVSLTDYGAETSHPAFSKLFVTTEEKDGVLYAQRRPRFPDEVLMTAYATVTECNNTKIETDRSSFRGSVVPDCFFQNQKAKTGVVLDPCFSIVAKVTVEKGESISVSFLSGLTENQKTAEKIVQKYREKPWVIHEEAYRASQEGVSLSEGLEKNFLEALPSLFYKKTSDNDILDAVNKNVLPAKDLWKWGISGDHPIITVKMENLSDEKLLDEALKAREYWQSKGIYTDIAVICDEMEGYTNPIFEAASKRKRAGVCVLGSGSLSEDDKTLLIASSSIYLRDGKGFHFDYLSKPLNNTEFIKDNCSDIPIHYDNLKYFNDYGGFDPKTNEYVIIQRRRCETPAPWVNVIANESFGFLSGESGGGCTWNDNSRESRITAWHNDPVFDKVTERLVISENGYVWSPMAGTFDVEGHFETRFGFGYTKYLRKCENIEHEVTMFVPVDKRIKIIVVSLKNIGEERTLEVSYSFRPVLGDFAHKTMGKLRKTDFGVENAFSGEKLYVNGDFDGQNVRCSETVYLKKGEKKDVVFTFGCEKADIVPNHEFEKVQNYWADILGAVKIKTPSDAMNIIMNGWLLYQTVSCRMLARTAFYQSGGAFGFRDQLQDSLALLYAKPGMVKKQILLHASRQFEEGDVLHWWHEGSILKGIRTRFSDDRLWLPYAVCEYIRVTGDHKILEEKVPYIVAPPLAENEDEKYIEIRDKTDDFTLLDHCHRAIDISLKTGEHGVPLFGSGDWNDGMNTVGNKGKGESVWLAWFLIYVLEQFTKLVPDEGYKEILRKLKSTNVWDGQWFLRGFYDDGEPLGSVQSDECKIDAISQAWSVIALGDGKNQRVAMNSLDRELTDRERGLIRLLSPPFDKGRHSPGYIKSYPAGIRENGGQYTHGAIWAGIAFALLDDKRAYEYFEMLNPINHTSSRLLANIYKGEPYVMSADIYTALGHEGQAGWTWYTGSAAWMYRFGLEYILGFKKEGENINIKPCVPEWWNDAEITFNGKKYKITDSSI